MKIGSLELKNNVFLAPMAGVTDRAYRTICSKMNPGLMFTEMVSSRGLYYENRQTKDLMEIDPREGQVAIQIFGSEPRIMKEVVSKYINPRKDIVAIDINMGCPSPKIVKNGDGAALGNDLGLAKEIISQVVSISEKPVSVKFRKGWDDDNITGVSLAKIAEQSGASFITVHGRTREMFYSGQADWDYIKKVKDSVSIPVIGNGDIFVAQDAKKMLDYTGCDGVLLGRGAMGNPWLIRDIVNLIEGQEVRGPSKQEKLDTVLEHLNLLVDFKGERIAIPEMRKHIGWYLKGMKNSSQMRNNINQITNKEDLILTLKEYFKD